MPIEKIRDSKGRFVKGHHYSSDTEFKAGKQSPRKGVRKPGWTNKTSFKPLWERDVRTYQGIHRWVVRKWGKPDFCEDCKEGGNALYHWANRSGKYLKDKSDWMRLCHRCHRVFDNRKIAIKRAANLVLNTHFNGGLIMAIGNGGSLSEANHLVSELSGKFEKENRPPIAAVSLSSPVTITAISNDFGYEYSFSRQIEALGSKGALLVCLTTSDYDPKTRHNINLWNAVSVARNRKKMKVLLIGSHKTKKLESYANCIVRGDGIETAEVQNDHLRIIHLICRYMERKLCV